MQTLTQSQIAEQNVRFNYPCINLWISFISNVSNYTQDYSSVSCLQIASISRAAAKTFGYIKQNDSNASVVRVARLLSNLQDGAWDAWTAFQSQANVATGIHLLGTNQNVLKGVESFRTWDDALQPIPSFNPPSLLAIILGGVTT